MGGALPGGTVPAGIQRIFAHSLAPLRAASWSRAPYALPCGCPLWWKHFLTLPSSGTLQTAHNETHGRRIDLFCPPTTHAGPGLLLSLHFCSKGWFVCVQEHKQTNQRPVGLTTSPISTIASIIKTLKRQMQAGQWPVRPMEGFGWFKAHFVASVNMPSA